MDSKQLLNEIKFWISKTIFSIELVDFSNQHVFEKSLEDFFLDYKRYYLDASIIEIDKVKKWLPLISMLTYRISRNFYLNGDEQSAGLISTVGKFFSGIEIFYSAEIGTGLRICHGVGTVIGARSKIGNNVMIHQNVTLGSKKAVVSDGKRPIIKDNVIIYSGAKILGPVIIGHNAIVAANAVVISDVPDNMKAIGVPAKLRNFD